MRGSVRGDRRKPAPYRDRNTFAVSKRPTPDNGVTGSGGFREKHLRCLKATNTPSSPGHYYSRSPEKHLRCLKATNTLRGGSRSSPIRSEKHLRCLKATNTLMDPSRQAPRREKHLRCLKATNTVLSRASCSILSFRRNTFAV